MSKAKTLASTVSTGGVLSDGSVAAAEVSGLAAVATSGAAADISGLASVATSGSFNDLSNKPSSSDYLPSQTGNSGKFLTTNGTSASWASISTNGAVFTAVASGTLSNGRMVNLKSDGTVEMVKETTTVYPDSIPAGSTTQFNGGTNATRYAIAWNNSVSDKFLLVYYDSADSNGKAVAGTVSGTTISFGSEIQVNDNSNFENPAVCCVPGTNDRYVIVWRGTNERGRAKVATVSGSTVSLGSETLVPTTTSFYSTGLAANWASSGSFVVTYFDNSNSNYITACAGSVSGDSISFGSRTVVTSSDSLGPTSIAFNASSSNNVGIITYRRNSNGNGYAKAVTVSGTSLSFGSEATWNSGGNASSDYTNNGFFIAGSQVTANQYALVNKNETTGYGEIYGATLSGTTITFSSATTFESSSLSSAPRVAYGQSSPNGLLVTYSTSSATYGYTMTMSGTTVTLGTKSTVYSGSSPDAVVTASNSSTTGRTYAIAYRGASSVPLAVIGTTGYSETTTNLSASLFVGASAGDYTNGQTATILVKGAISTAQSGLTVNSTYYLQGNGTLSTTAASPSVLAGRALAADKILIGAT